MIGFAFLAAWKWVVWNILGLYTLYWLHLIRQVYFNSLFPDKHPHIAKLGTLIFHPNSYLKLLTKELGKTQTKGFHCYESLISFLDSLHLIGEPLELSADCYIAINFNQRKKFNAEIWQQKQSSVVELTLARASGLLWKWSNAPITITWDLNFPFVQNQMV